MRTTRLLERKSTGRRPSSRGKSGHRRGGAKERKDQPVATKIAGEDMP